MTHHGTCRSPSNSESAHHLLPPPAPSRAPASRTPRHDVNCRPPHGPARLLLSLHRSPEMCRSCGTAALTPALPSRGSPALPSRLSPATFLNDDFQRHRYVTHPRLSAVGTAQAPSAATRRPPRQAFLRRSYLVLSPRFPLTARHTCGTLDCTKLQTAPASAHRAASSWRALSHLPPSS